MLLGEDNVRTELQKIDVAWAVVGGTTLNRVYELADFSSGVSFINEVSTVVDKLSHHPDIYLSYFKVEINVTTHSAGGLTAKDFDFAKAIDKISS